MSKFVVLSAVLCLSIACGIAVADEYVPDETHYLPLEPHPDYPDATNWVSGDVTLDDVWEDPYVIVLENKLNFLNWKEWILDLNITPLNQDDWWLEVHFDVSQMIDPSQSPPLLDRMAYWDVLIAGDTNPVSEWMVVGVPGNRNPLKVDPFATEVDVYCDMEIPPFGEPFEYLDWNPEWVSLEFTGDNVKVDYVLVDWCIPEPATLSLLGFGGLAMLKRRR